MVIEPPSTPDFSGKERNSLRNADFTLLKWMICGKLALYFQGSVQMADID